MNLLQRIIWKKIHKEELDQEEMRDLMDYLNTLKEELHKLRIILYNDYVGYICDFDVIIKEPWYCSEVHFKCLELGEYGFLYLDDFIWRLATGGIEVKPFIRNEVTRP